MYHTGSHRRRLAISGGVAGVDWESTRRGHYVAVMPDPVLRISDDDGREVTLDARASADLLAMTAGLDAATVSACPDCESRVLAVVALVDLLRSGPPHPQAFDLIELAEDAPTLHVFVVDDRGACTHRRWRDPGFEEWQLVADTERGRARA